MQHYNAHAHAVLCQHIRLNSLNKLQLSHGIVHNVMGPYSQIATSA